MRRRPVSSRAQTPRPRFKVEAILTFSDLLREQRAYETGWVADLVVDAERRRQGIGSRLLKEIVAEAEGAGLPVRIHVERNNPALGLYRRLGFVQRETNVYRYTF